MDGFLASVARESGMGVFSLVSWEKAEVMVFVRGGTGGIYV